MSAIPLSRSAILRARMWRLLLALLRGFFTIAIVLATAFAAAHGAVAGRAERTGSNVVLPLDELGLMENRDAARRGQSAARRMTLSQPGQGWTANDAVDAGWLPPDDAARIALVATPDGVRVLPRPLR